MKNLFSRTNSVKLILLIFLCLSFYSFGCKAKDSNDKPNNITPTYDLKGKWISEDRKIIIELYDKAYFTNLINNSKTVRDYEIDHNIIKFHFTIMNIELSDFYNIIDENNIEETTKEGINVKYKKEK